MDPVNVFNSVTIHSASINYILCTCQYTRPWDKMVNKIDLSPDLMEFTVQLETNNSKVTGKREMQRGQMVPRNGARCYQPTQGGI